MAILVINAGSSTIKAALFALNSKLDTLWENKVEFKQQDSEGLSKALKKMVISLWKGKSKIISGPQAIKIVGHRVVHGGDRFITPVLINNQVKKVIKDLCFLAPLHNPLNLEGIRVMEELVQCPQVAVFDTAFHRTMSKSASEYAIPETWRDAGVHRYGFHGISHAYCMERTKTMLNEDILSKKIITCHLGNGSSLAAIYNCKSIDTTMGFTPLEGLVMGSRSGSIDPDIITFMMRRASLSTEEIERVLNFESGLLGICGSSDMRAVIQSRSSSSKAQLAYEMYLHSLKRYIGAMLGVLGGLDVLVFTGGIGENAIDLRTDVCKGFSFLGMKLNEAKNQQNDLDCDISDQASTIRILAIHTREEYAIANACAHRIQHNN